MSSEKTFEHKGRIIRAEIRTSATPQQAWEAWADPQKIAAWFVDRAAGEAKPGGIMTWFFDDFGYQLPYKVVDAIPGSLFVLKWDPPQGDSGILEVRIAQEGGATIVRLTNSGFREDAKWNDEYEGVNSGWQTALALLKEYLENYFGRSKKTVMILRPASYTHDQLREYFLDPAKLSKWLSVSGAIGKPGESCELILRDGGKLSGRVLAVTKWEAALSWKEISGALELKGFSMGPQKMLGVRVTLWNSDSAANSGIKARMEAAVERLAAIFPAPAGAAVSSASESQFKEPFEKKS
jgi:uncharacterized protein YndB with AHSA1/START domain